MMVNESDSKEKYCSKPCYFEDQKEELIKRARRVGRESAQKISETKKKMFASGELIHPRLGVKLEEETKAKISKANKKYYETHDGYWKGKTLSVESREKMSETRTKKWINGDYDHIKRCWAQGLYFFEKEGREVYYRSSWELAFMKYLDAKDDVKWAKYERLRIPYRDIDNEKKHYIPDILVGYTSGRQVLYEIKPFSRKGSEINVLKFKSAHQYCKENNIEFKVITERYLKRIGAMT